MLIRHLFYFVTLARERHFARAAEASNVAQPTLSAAIRKLEEDLEARLVIRNHQFVGLTPEGERVLAWGRQMATRVSLGKRTFLRRFHKATGVTPTRYLQHLRVGKA